MMNEDTFEIRPNRDPRLKKDKDNKRIRPNRAKRQKSSVRASRVWEEILEQIEEEELELGPVDTAPESRTIVYIEEA
jgi:hypothetical protein